MYFFIFPKKNRQGAFVSDIYFLKNEKDKWRSHAYFICIQHFPNQETSRWRSMRKTTVQIPTTVILTFENTPNPTQNSPKRYRNWQSQLLINHKSCRYHLSLSLSLYWNVLSLYKKNTKKKKRQRKKKLKHSLESLLFLLCFLNILHWSVSLFGFSFFWILN